MHKTKAAEVFAPTATTTVRIDESIRCRLRDCPYAFMFNRIDWQYDRGILTLWGAVQSFYLKQVLQELVRHVDEVEQVINEVDVVSPRGLSSVRKASPPAIHSRPEAGRPSRARWAS